MLGSFVGPAAQHESDNQAIVHLLLLLLLLHGALNLKISKSSKAFQVTHMSVLGQNFPISLLFCFSPPSSQHYGREGKVFLNSLKMKFHFVAILSLIISKCVQIDCIKSASPPSPPSPSPPPSSSDHHHRDNEHVCR